MISSPVASHAARAQRLGERRAQVGVAGIRAVLHHLGRIVGERALHRAPELGHRKRLGRGVRGRERDHARRARLREPVHHAFHPLPAREQRRFPGARRTGASAGSDAAATNVPRPTRETTRPARGERLVRLRDRDQRDARARRRANGSAAAVRPARARRASIARPARRRSARRAAADRAGRARSPGSWRRLVDCRQRHAPHARIRAHRAARRIAIHLERGEVLEHLERRGAAHADKRDQPRQFLPDIQDGERIEHDRWVDRARHRPSSPSSRRSSAAEARARARGSRSRLAGLHTTARRQVPPPARSAGTRARHVRA